MRVKSQLVGPSYQARSLNADAQRTLNCFVELDNASPRAPMALYGTPGTVRKLTLPTSPVRGCIQQGSYSWWVAGDSVYRVDSAWNYTLLGTISTSSGDVSMASNGAQILIVDGVGGWIITVASAAFAAIADADFPAGVRRAAYQDGYFLVTGKEGSPSFWFNETPYAGGAWDALDFASAEGSPDNNIGLISDHRELWLFGSDSTEIWGNSGATDVPFVRSGNAFIEHGCASAATIAKADNTVFWLGADDKGAGIVWRADGYTPLRISTHALEHAIAGYSTIADALSFTYQQEGHIFYVLTFPTAGKTWVYDAATQMWHERAWRNPSTGALSRWRANCHCYFAGYHLVGDYEDGRIYALDLDTYTDDGDPILRLRRSKTGEADQRRLFISMLQIDMETGVGLATGQGSDPVMMLRFSDDGGHVWSNQRTATVGRMGEYGARCKFTRLGAGRNRLFEISMTDPVKFAVFSAVVDGEPGTD